MTEVCLLNLSLLQALTSACAGSLNTLTYLAFSIPAFSAALLVRSPSPFLRGAPVDFVFYILLAYEEKKLGFVLIADTAFFSCWSRW